jgi:hypothetical protein
MRAKRLKRRAKGARAGLARRLLCRGAGLALALALGGCLMPQDDELLPELPPTKNRPPRILEGSAVPQQQVSIPVGFNCTPERWAGIFEFSAKVEDPDVDNPIRNRWFVDPDDKHTTVFFQGLTLPPSTKPTRDTPVKAPANLIASSPLSTPGKRRLVLVISDGEFEEGVTPTRRLVRLPDGGLTEDLSYTDSFTWLVNSDPSQSCD